MELVSITLSGSALIIHLHCRYCRARPPDGWNSAIIKTPNQVNRISSWHDNLLHCYINNLQVFQRCLIQPDYYEYNLSSEKQISDCIALLADCLVVFEADV